MLAGFWRTHLLSVIAGPVNGTSNGQVTYQAELCGNALSVMSQAPWE